MISDFNKSMLNSQHLDCSASFHRHIPQQARQDLALETATLCSREKVEKKRSATTCLLTQQVGFSFGFEVDVLVCFHDWQARGERFDGGFGAHIRVCLDPLGMLWALKGQRGRTGASVSANLVGR